MELYIDQLAACLVQKGFNVSDAAQLKGGNSAELAPLPGGGNPRLQHCIPSKKYPSVPVPWFSLILTIPGTTETMGVAEYGYSRCGGAGRG